jgi:hypothetical protein
MHHRCGYSAGAAVRGELLRNCRFFLPSTKGTRSHNTEKHVATQYDKSTVRQHNTLQHRTRRWNAAQHARTGSAEERTHLQVPVYKAASVLQMVEQPPRRSYQDRHAFDQFLRLGLRAQFSLAVPCARLPAGTKLCKATPGTP